HTQLSHFLLLFVAPALSRPPSSPLFPYTTLFRSRLSALRRTLGAALARPRPLRGKRRVSRRHRAALGLALPRLGRRGGQPGPALDRKSTRLNSSHVKISYAVFCLKKKKKKKTNAS